MLTNESLLLADGRFLLLVAGDMMSRGFDHTDWIDPNLKRPKDGQDCWMVFVTHYNNAPRDVSIQLGYYDRGEFCDGGGNHLVYPYRWMPVRRPKPPEIE